MSVLIKGLHKPDENHHCPFVDAEYGYCLVDLGITGRGEKCEYMKDCPLIELPDHGDLIDREYAVGSACSGRIRALPTTEDGEDWIRVEEVRQSLKSVPAVIPAERSEE